MKPRSGIAAVCLAGLAWSVWCTGSLQELLFVTTLYGLKAFCVQKENYHFNTLHLKKQSARSQTNTFISALTNKAQECDILILNSLLKTIIS